MTSTGSPFEFDKGRRKVREKVHKQAALYRCATIDLFPPRGAVRS